MLALLCLLLWAAAAPALPLRAQTTPGAATPSGATVTGGAAAPEDALLTARVETLLAQMSPADRVGQLFLISFQGNATDFESDIV